MAPEAFYGWPGQWVRDLEPYTEADPVALLVLGLGAFGHCAGRARVQGQPLRLSMVLVGDGRAGGEAAWGHVDRLFSGVSQYWKKDEHLPLRALPPYRDWPRLVEGWDGKGTNWAFLGRGRPEEIRGRLSRQEAGDFASRTLLLRIHGGHAQPLGEVFPEGIFQRAVKELKNSLDFVRSHRVELSWTPEAAELWKPMYSVLREPRGAGAMIDNMTERAERHVLRLAGLYAIMDQRPEIKLEYLFAALALWDYHEQTLRDLFAGQTGDKKMDQVLRYLCEHSRATTDEIRCKVLKNNYSAGPILEKLKDMGLVDSHKEPGRGQPCWWWLTKRALDGSSARSYLAIAKDFRDSLITK